MPKQESVREKKLRIFYQDILYKICGLFDKADEKCNIHEVYDKVKSLKCSHFSKPSIVPSVEEMAQIIGDYQMSANVGDRSVEINRRAAQAIHNLITKE